MVSFIIADFQYYIIIGSNPFGFTNHLSYIASDNQTFPIKMLTGCRERKRPIVALKQFHIQFIL